MFAAKIRRNVRKFRSDRDGSSAILFAIAVPVVVGFTALLQVRKTQVFGTGLKTGKFKPDLVGFAKANCRTRDSMEDAALRRSGVPTRRLSHLACCIGDMEIKPLFDEPEKHGTNRSTNWKRMQCVARIEN